MKTIFIVLSAWILFSIGSCREDYTARKYGGLKGNVENIRDTVYELAQLGSFILDEPGDIRETTIFDFDREGNLIKSMVYLGTDSIPFEINEYTYINNMLSSSYSGTRASDGTYSTFTSEAIPGYNGTRYKDNNGTQTWERQVNTSGKYQCHLSKGEWGYSKEEIWADKNNNIIRHQIQTVSKELEGVTRDGTNSIKWTSVTKYDENDFEIENTCIENKDTTTSAYMYSRYDDHGNWTERKEQINGHFKYLVRRSIKYADSTYSHRNLPCGEDGRR